MNSHSKLTVLVVLMFLPAMGCEKEEGGEEFQTRVTMLHDGYRLLVIDNSDSISQAIAINAHGHVIGSREQPSATPGIFENIYFFDDGQHAVDLPTLENYTNSEVESLSDNYFAVGYASRPTGNVDGTLIALLWDIKKNQVINLSKIEGDLVSHAQDISSDGKRIVGYSTGNSPERLRPCIWEFSETEKKWVAEALPTKEVYNPYTMSSSVQISPDGKTIATCITDFIDDRTINSSLYLWREDEQGQWQRKKLHDEQIYVGGVNNAGLVVGDFSNRQGKRFPCIVSAEGEFRELELFDGTDSGKAYGVSNKGMVVGICNDPPGPDGGVHPWIFDATGDSNKPQPLKLPAENLYCLVQSINDAGQIAGLGEITFKDRLEENPETGEEEPVVKALAFIWDPQSSK
ncbi:MAG: hypothetical protein AAF483_00655 [Planctomycetota bacterium]